MKPIPKWLLIPPAVALLLVLGPIAMQGGGIDITEPATLSAEPSAADDAPNRDGLPTLPRTPDFWQIGSTLIGVLLLGGIAIYGLRRLRGGAVPTRGAKTKLMTLRQTLRLTQRQAVHAIEFDDRILLVGETERGLALIESGSAPETVSDEADATAHAATMLESALLHEEEGAVPRNLVIPRPDNPTRPIPTPPATGRPAARSPNLNEFRALLQKAGRA